MKQQQNQFPNKDKTTDTYWLVTPTGWHCAGDNENKLRILRTSLENQNIPTSNYQHRVTTMHGFRWVSTKINDINIA